MTGAMRDTLGIVFTGPLDVLAGRFTAHPRRDYCLHGRYTLDPPEVATFAYFPDEPHRHWGFHRDEPASGRAAVVEADVEGGHFAFVADNALAALMMLATGPQRPTDRRGRGGRGGRGTKGKGTGRGGGKAAAAGGKELERVKAAIEQAAAEFKLPLLGAPAKRHWQERKKRVVGRTLSGLGLVVKVVDDVGYRPLPYDLRELKGILRRAEPKDGDREPVRDVLNNINLANDECDFGMGLEFGLNLWGFSNAFTPPAAMLLELAYQLLDRPGFLKVLQAHTPERQDEQARIDLLD